MREGGGGDKSIAESGGQGAYFPDGNGTTLKPKKRTFSSGNVGGKKVAREKSRSFRPEQQKLAPSPTQSKVREKKRTTAGDEGLGVKK